MHKLELFLCQSWGSSNRQGSSCRYLALFALTASLDFLTNPGERRASCHVQNRKGSSNRPVSTVFFLFTHREHFASTNRRVAPLSESEALAVAMSSKSSDPEHDHASPGPSPWVATDDRKKEIEPREREPFARAQKEMYVTI